MRNIILLTSFIIFCSIGFAGDGGVGGGTSSIQKEILIRTLGIHSIETLDRELIHHSDIKNYYNVENGYILNGSDILNIEYFSGELKEL